MGLLSRKKGRELGGPILLGGDEGRLCFEVGLGYSPYGNQGFLSFPQLGGNVLQSSSCQ